MSESPPIAGVLQTPESIHSIATITELRSNTSEVIKTAETSEEGVLVTKNNAPYAVLVSFDHYVSLVDGSE